MIKWEFDYSADALYVRVTEQPIERTLDLSDQVNVDLDADGSLIGIEVVVLSAGWDPELLAPYLDQVDEVTRLMLARVAATNALGQVLPEDRANFEFVPA